MASYKGGRPACLPESKCSLACQPPSCWHAHLYDYASVHSHTRAHWHAGAAISSIDPVATLAVLADVEVGG